MEVVIWFRTDVFIWWDCLFSTLSIRSSPRQIDRLLLGGHGPITQAWHICWARSETSGLQVVDSCKIALKQTMGRVRHLYWLVVFLYFDINVQILTIDNVYIRWQQLVQRVLLYGRFQNCKSATSVLSSPRRILVHYTQATSVRSVDLVGGA